MNSVHGPSFLASFITSITESPSTCSRMFLRRKKQQQNLILSACLSVCMFDLFLSIFFCLLPWDSLWTHRNNNLSQESFVCNTSEMGRGWFSLGHEKPVSYTRNKSIFCWGSVHPVRRWFRTTALFSVKFLERLLKFWHKI